MTPVSEHDAHELQEMEANIQSLLMQKQQIQLELNEIDNALAEIKNSDEVYKIVSGVMIKSNFSRVKEELEEKKKFAKMRISSI